MTEPLTMKRNGQGHWEKDFGPVQQHTPDDCPKCLLATIDADRKRMEALVDAVMQHLGGERLDSTCACPLGDVLDDIPKSAWGAWHRRMKA